VDRELMSQWSVRREVVTRHRLVHNRHARASLILRREVAPGDERRAERFEIPWRHDVQRHAAPLVRILSEPWYRDELTAGGARNWRHPGKRDRPNSSD